MTPALVPDAELAGPRDWIDAHLHRFGPGERGLSTTAWTKRAVELGMLAAALDVAAAASPPVAALVGPTVAGWVQRAGRVVGGPEHLAAVGRAGTDGAYLIQPYLWFRGLGHRSEAGEEALRVLARGGVRPNSVGALHCFWRAGLLRDAPPWQRWCTARVAAWRRLDGPALDRDGYRITHAVLYGTDLGARPFPVPVDDLLHRLLARAHGQGRRDLTAEVLLSLALADHPAPADCAPCRAPADELARCRRPDGSLAGTDGPPDAFVAAYHPTMVELWRAAATLARTRSGP